MRRVVWHTFFQFYIFKWCCDLISILSAGSFNSEREILCCKIWIAEWSDHFIVQIYVTGTILIYYQHQVVGLSECQFSVTRSEILLLSRIIGHNIFYHCHSLSGIRCYRARIILNTKRYRCSRSSHYDLRMASSTRTSQSNIRFNRVLIITYVLDLWYHFLRNRELSKVMAVCLIHVVIIYIICDQASRYHTIPVIKYNSSPWIIGETICHQCSVTVGETVISAIRELKPAALFHTSVPIQIIYFITNKCNLVFV